MIYSPKTRADLIDVLHRTMDGGWLDPLLADADSAAVLDALADVLAYLSTIGVTDVVDTTISGAPGGVSGTSVVTLTRSTPGIGGTIPIGYRFADSRGLIAISQAPVAVGAGALSVAVAVQTIRRTELVNTVDDPLYAVAADNVGAPDSGGTNALVSPPGPPSGLPPIVATTFLVVGSSTPVAGGASDWLAAVGRERGQRRGAGEGDASLRARIRNVPDAVSPIAVAQAVQGAAQHASLPPIDVSEPFVDGATPALKANYNLTSFSGTYDTDFFTDAIREMNDLRTFRRYFRLQPESVPDNPDGSGLYFGDGYFDDPVFGFTDTGFNPILFSGLMSILEEANRKRAAGVAVDLYEQSAQQITQVSFTTSNALHLMWAKAAPTGFAWLYADGVYSHDFALAPQPTSGTVAGAFHRIVFTFTDASTWAAPDWALGWEQHLTLAQALALGMPELPITLIQGYAVTDNVHPINLVGTTYVYPTAL